MAAKTRATEAEIEQRRAEVLRLRFAQLSESEIAERMGVSVPTVSRDLAAIQAEWANRFGTEFEPARELGEAVALYKHLEGAALRELHRVEAEGGSTAARLKCMQTAGAMRDSRLDLLHKCGLVGKKVEPPPQNRIQNANEIRERLRASGILDELTESSVS